jgi:ABC-type Na+ efflux pump permease subunit
MAPKGESFSIEAEVLEKARNVVERGDAVSEADIREAFSKLVEEYGKLLDEARFLTKISDKLETKLNKANEELKVFNEALANEAEKERFEKERAVNRSKKLITEKTETEKRSEKIQMLMIILIALFLVTVVTLVYLFVFDGIANWVK